jgi:hypothetical protein
LNPPASAQVGERITFAGFPTDASVPELARANEKTLKVVMGKLKTNGEGVAMYKDIPFQTTAGPVKADTLKNAPIR